MKFVGFRIPEHLLNRVQDLAAENGMAMSEAYRHIIQEFFRSDQERNLLQAIERLNKQIGSGSNGNGKTDPDTDRDNAGKPDERLLQDLNLIKTILISIANSNPRARGELIDKLPEYFR